MRVFQYICTIVPNLMNFCRIKTLVKRFVLGSLYEKHTLDLGQRVSVKKKTLKICISTVLRYR